jgi:hypothetical protein
MAVRAAEPEVIGGHRAAPPLCQTSHALTFIDITLDATICDLAIRLTSVTRASIRSRLAVLAVSLTATRMMLDERFAPRPER